LARHAYVGAVRARLVLNRIALFFAVRYLVNRMIGLCGPTNLSSVG
jgi:hypothetical protein